MCSRRSGRSAEPGSPDPRVRVSAGRACRSRTIWKDYRFCQAVDLLRISGPGGVALPVHIPPGMASGADILVIDDDPVVRETVGDVLREHGHHVDRVDRGQDALTRVGQPRPGDLAIVHCRLPDPSGLDLLHNIKTRSPETEVILITGHASLDGALAAMAGAASYLVKPVDTAQLLSAVDRALARQGLLRPLRGFDERYRLITESLTEALFLLGLAGPLAR